MDRVAEIRKELTRKADICGVNFANVNLNDNNETRYFVFFEIEDDLNSQIELRLMIQHAKKQRNIPERLLDAIIRKNSKHGEPLLNEIDADSMHKRSCVRLGECFKFINPEASINILLKHAANQYAFYLQEGGAESHQIQWAACSGAPGRGKTTFCRKAFSAAVHSSNGDGLWTDVSAEEDFRTVVESCVDEGRQFQIQLVYPFLGDEELTDPSASFSYRLLKCMTERVTMDNVAQVLQDRSIYGSNKRNTCSLVARNYKKVSFEDAPELQELLLKLTGGVKESLVVVNFDETNAMLKCEDTRKRYLTILLSAVEKFNKLQKGFVFCIMSGTNVQNLHEVLTAAAKGNSPVEISLPLLTNEQMTEVVEELGKRANNNCSVERTPESVETLEFILTTLGGVPRCVEALVFCLGRDNTKRFDTSLFVRRLQNPPPTHQLLIDVRKTITDRYGLVFQDMMRGCAVSEGWKALLSASLFQWDMSRDTRLGLYTVRELEYRGILYVRQGKTNHTIVFPLLFLPYILPAGDFCPMLLRNLDVELSPYENEHITLAILLVKCEALRVLKRPMTVDALFPGYAPNFALRGSSFEVNHLGCLQNLTDPVTSQNWDKFESEKREGGYDGFYINPKGAAFSDQFVIPKNVDFSILIRELNEERATRHSLGYDSVKEEHHKCNVKTPHLFVLMSDNDLKAADRDKLENNEIVLPRNEHEKALGPLMAMLRLCKQVAKQQLPQKRKSDCF